MSGDKIEKSWGSLTSSSQELHPAQWMDYARQLLAEYTRKETHRKSRPLNAIVKVMERLTCTIPMVFGDDVREVVPGALDFDEAFRIYEEYV